MKTAQIVLGLGYGDEGKGITVDFLASRKPNSLVVRFSGGSNAGHTVMLDDKKHIHQNFGSGTLRGLTSYFTKDCAISPAEMAQEKTELQKLGLNPQVYVHPLTKIITPYDIAFNRIKEEYVEAHGSCGVGVGATMHRNLTSPVKFTALDYAHLSFTESKMYQIYEYYRNTKEAKQYYKEYDKIANDLWYPFMQNKDIIKLSGDSIYNDFDNVIFEGSQGILLDMDHGFFPNVTYANTTSKNAIAILNEFGIDPDIFYVTRCYSTRHGAGQFSAGELPELLINNQEEINVPNDWQGTMRVGEIDYRALNYALDVDNIYSPFARKHLVVTCMDQRPNFEFEYEMLNYKFHTIRHSYSPYSKDFKQIHKKDVYDSK